MYIDLPDVTMFKEYSIFSSLLKFVARPLILYNVGLFLDVILFNFFPVCSLHVIFTTAKLTTGTACHQISSEWNLHCS